MSHDVMEIVAEAAGDKRDDTATLEVVYMAALCFQESWRDRLFQLHGPNWQTHDDKAVFDAALQRFCAKLWRRLSQRMALS